MGWSGGQVGGGNLMYSRISTVGVAWVTPIIAGGHGITLNDKKCRWRALFG